VEHLRRAAPVGGDARQAGRSQALSAPNTLAARRCGSTISTADPSAPSGLG
jgi:hypothetical protein